MYLLLNKPGHPPERFEVVGNCAVIGRASQCDVVIDEEFVSKQHCKVLQGVVLVDTSTNGTYVNGERVAGGILLGDRPAQIGRSEITITVGSDTTISEPSGSVVPNPIAKPAAGDGSALRAENDRLKRQLAEASRAGVDTKKYADAIDTLRRENEALRTRIDELSSQPPAPEPAAPVPSAEVPEAPGQDSPLFAQVLQLQNQVKQLKHQLAEQAAAAPPAPEPAPETPSAGDADSIVPVARDESTPPTSKPKVDFAKAFPNLRAGGGGTPTPPAATPTPPPPVGSGNGATRLTQLVQNDVESVPTQLEEPLDAFLLVEGFRFLRRVERVVTRLAGGLIQLYQLHTMVPGVEGTLRAHLGDALQNPTTTTDREALLEYLRELGRWLVVALGAHRRAAEKIVESIKTDLTPESLSAQREISGLKKMNDKVCAELWRRSSTYLHELTPDLVNERLDKLARESADELVESDSEGF